jgi:poly(A) polymerase
MLDRLLQVATGQRLALVGGAVRDLLLHRVHNDPWRGVPDLDLVVESRDPSAGQAGETAEAVAPAHGVARRLCALMGPEAVMAYQEHGNYGTVELELRLEEGPLLLDLASARRETYPVAGENPVVNFGSLQEDLARRDFTINAMALLLEGDIPAEHGPERGQSLCHDDTSPADRFWATLLDPHGGQTDLGRRQLRFLHPSSVRDDPTRILRAARYAARMGFRLAPPSLEQVSETLAQWPWRWRVGDPPGQAPSALGTRLRMELELLLERENWRAALQQLQAWGGLILLDASLQADRRWQRRLCWGRRLGLDRMTALLAGAADPIGLAERLQLPHRQHRQLAQFLTLRDRLDAVGGAEDLHSWSPSRWSTFLERPGVSPEAVALALAAGGVPRRPLLRWWARWRHLRSTTTAENLVAAGLSPGPALGRRLRELRAERLDRERLWGARRDGRSVTATTDG